MVIEIQASRDHRRQYICRY